MIIEFFRDKRFEQKGIKKQFSIESSVPPEIINEILEKSNVSIEKTYREDYPEAARRMINEITEEKLKDLIKNNVDFSKSYPMYFTKLNKKGWPDAVCDQKEKRSIGVHRFASLVISEDKENDVRVIGNFDLIETEDGNKRIRVIVYARRINFDFPREEDDGRCAKCQGFGCWTCRYTGGY
jgi:hypothetical protein